MWTLKSLIQHPVTTEINGKWVPCRPHREPLIQRMRAAWAVLTGRADAFTWPEGQ